MSGNTIEKEEDYLAVAFRASHDIFVVFFITLVIGTYEFSWRIHDTQTRYVSFVKPFMGMSKQ